MAGAFALLLVGLALALAGCGGSSTTAASTPSGTAPATTATGAHGSTTAAKGAKRSGKAAGQTTTSKPSKALRAAMTAQWRRGNRAGHRACTGFTATTALAHVVALAKAAERKQHVAVRAGMLARVKQLPKSALHGRAAPAMAAALIAVGMPIQQRAGAFAGCMAVLRAHH